MVPRRTPVSRRGRPAKPPLSRAGIVAVALRVMGEEGLERVTMRRLAQELDTGPASLYVYVDNIAELHGAILDELLASVDFDPDVPPGRWRDRLVELLFSYAQVLSAHPSLARSVLLLRPSGPHYLRLIDSLLALLYAGGVPARQAAWGVDILLQMATATAAEQGTRGQSVDAEGEHEALVSALREALADAYPHIVRTGGELVSGAGPGRFRWALQSLIDGIAMTPAPSTEAPDA